MTFNCLFSDMVTAQSIQDLQNVLFILSETIFVTFRFSERLTIYFLRPSFLTTIATRTITAVDVLPLLYSIC